MTTNSPKMRVCLRKNKIFISRNSIALIGNPTHLEIRYDEQDGILYFSPSKPDALYAYEIPKFFWTGRRQNCEISKIAFLKALQYRIGWENNSKYIYEGQVINLDDVPTLVYMLANGVRVL